MAGANGYAMHSDILIGIFEFSVISHQLFLPTHFDIIVSFSRFLFSLAFFVQYDGHPEVSM